MNKDRIEGKVKDLAGRIERQAGEWTGDPKKQAKGTVKQLEGKLQNAIGKVKDAVKKESDGANTALKPPQGVPDSTDSEEGLENSRRFRR
jgi:uncharacterized protein YjbJ (UPF0337 family)